MPRRVRYESEHQHFARGAAALACAAALLGCTSAAPAVVRAPSVRAEPPGEAVAAERATLQPAPTRVEEATPPGADVHWLGARRAVAGTLRGDWDISSALLVVYNRNWQAPIQRMLAIAHNDLPVYVLATPRDARTAAFQRWFSRIPFAGLVSIALDTPWIRDYGPLEVQSNGEISWLDTIYAPEDRPRDDAVPTLLSQVFETPHQAEPRFHLEGGGIISNGEGLCGITEASLLDLGLADAGAEQRDDFLETIGCRTLARLPELPSEATGHVDMLAQFLSPRQVAIAVPTEGSPPEVADALRGARQALAQAGAAHGLELEFVELPLVNRDDLYFSYVNGLRTPAHYFVPSYSFVDPALEALAHARLAGALEGVEVVGVDSDEMIENGGAVHCVTLGLKHPLQPRSNPRRLPGAGRESTPGRVTSSPKLSLELPRDFSRDFSRNFSRSVSSKSSPHSSVRSAPRSRVSRR
jgi:agmatine deiminase